LPGQVHVASGDGYWNSNYFVHALYCLI
jgi:hypothetical protein